MSQEGYGMQNAFGRMDSGQMVDLNITQTEVSPGGASDDFYPPAHVQGGASNDFYPPAHVHARSSSDSLVVLQCGVSSSLPDLINPDSSTSPENQEGEGSQEGVANIKFSPSMGHTRHLSLIGNLHLGNAKRKKPKRATSFKQRSRSPPNLPPPPPPPAPEGGEEPPPLPPPPVMVDGEENGIEFNGPTPNPSSSASLGYSEVLSTITNIDQQLDMMTEQFASDDHTLSTSTFKPVQPQQSPARSANVANILFHHPKLGLSPAPALGPSPVPEEEAEFDFKVEFQEDEWLCDLPGERHAPPAGTTATDRDIGPLPLVISVHTSPGHTLTDGEPVSPNKSAKKHRVMFKDEVEDIPNYEPRVDEVVTPVEEEELLVGVAAIKARLFGQQEQEATRYKKEGVLRPKHIHPVNVEFSEDYFQESSGTEGSGFRDVSPNINNNNSEEESMVSDSSVVAQTGAPVRGGGGAQPEASKVPLPNHSTGRERDSDVVVYIPDDPPEPEQNLYDSPWEQKTVSKYKMIGIKQRSGSPGLIKEKTPPPVAPKKAGQKIHIAEVSVMETPKPNTTEVRNVHSLERRKSNGKRRHSQGRTSVSPPTPGGVANGEPEDSLLASISNTLQVTSRYGSDSFLSNGDVTAGGVASGKRSSSGEIKFSSRGELEKIRAAHRKEATPTVPHPSPLVQANVKPIQRSTPQIYTAKSPNHTPNHKGVAMGGASSRVASSSLEGLQQRPDTHVTYDAQTQAHIFRSLV